MAKKSYEIKTNIPMTLALKPSDAAQLLGAILCQEYGLPLGDFDMHIRTIEGKRLVCCIQGDVFEGVVKSDEGTLVSVISHNPEATVLFEAYEILEHMK